jgi:VWFA-related protein
MVTASTARTIAAAVIAGAAVVGGVSVALLSQEQQPTPFRSGTNIVRVDATVIDRSGRPVSTLTADDFEVREDGAVQPVTSFKFLANTGQPSDDRSLPIRSQQHAAAEAARDDVRVFLVFWDEYHIGQFESAVRARDALSRIVLSAFGPTDLVAIMDPLTPSSAIEFTRDRRALSDRIHRLEGRRGVYLPPRSAAEEAQLEAVNWNAPAVEVFRSQVMVTAIKAAAAHLGTLREGRKTMIVVTEGLSMSPPVRGIDRGSTLGAGPGPGAVPPMAAGAAMRRYADDQSSALDIVRAANDSNTAVHIIDPRGLQVSGGTAGMLETLAYGSGGELHQSNDIGQAMQRIVAQSSATYLLGYTKDIVQDGKFHEIKVRVKRGGYDVRSRAGYWAPRKADVERAKTAAAAAVLPEPIATAFASLTPSNSSRLVEVWVGRWPMPEGRSELTVAWTPVAGAAPGATPARVTARVTSADTSSVEKTIEAAGTRFDVPDGDARIEIRVLDTAGEVLDRETRTIGADGESPLGISAVVHVARTPAEMRTIGAADAPIHAGREFVRTDRLLVRIRAYGTAAAGAELTGRLIDRRGATLIPLAIGGPANGWYQLDFPLASIAAGEFAIVLEARSGDARAETIVPLRVRR